MAYILKAHTVKTKMISQEPESHFAEEQGNCRHRDNHLQPLCLSITQAHWGTTVTTELWIPQDENPLHVIYRTCPPPKLHMWSMHRYEGQSCLCKNSWNFPLLPTNHFQAPFPLTPLLSLQYPPQKSWEHRSEHCLLSSCLANLQWNLSLCKRQSSWYLQ